MQGGRAKVDPISVAGFGPPVFFFVAHGAGIRWVVVSNASVPATAQRNKQVGADRKKNRGGGAAGTIGSGISLELGFM
ncbi:hypothetical protein GCM10018966_025910 [Streptomyces yanii]